MLSRKYYLLLIPGFLVLFTGLGSCKKKDLTYSFKGTVIESASGAGLSDVSVKLYQVLFDQSSANSNFQLAGEVSTDGSGNYEIVIDRQKALQFKVAFRKNGFFTEEVVISSSDVSTEEAKEVNQYMDAESWIVFDIYNASPDISDQLTLVKYNFREGCLGCTTNDYAYFYGPVDTTITIHTTAGIYTRFTYKDEVSSLITEDSVLTVPFDTVFYSINY